MRSFPIEYYVLPHVSTAGPILGYLAGRPILACVQDQFGKRYRFAGLVPRRPDGTFNVKMLQPGEWIVEPGFVYASEDVPDEQHR